jgi:hypothetical protein
VLLFSPIAVFSSDITVGPPCSGVGQTTRRRRARARPSSPHER